MALHPLPLRRMGSLLEQKSVDGSLRLGIEIHESLVESSAVAGHSTNPMATGMEPRAPMDGALAVPWRPYGQAPEPRCSAT